MSTMNAGIGTSAFEGCTRLRSIELPEGITTLSDNAFKGDTSLRSATFPSTLTGIGSSTFRDCSVLANVALPGSLTSIGSNAFDGCMALEEANLGSTITSLGASAYANSGLTSVTVPGSISALIPNAFENCDALKIVNIESGTKSLGANSFAGCDELEEVKLSDTVTVIAANAFANCPKLAKVWFQGDAPTIAANSFDGVTATALYPVDSEYWEETDMVGYGGTLTWTPYGDISTCELSADDLVYAGVAQEPVTHLRAANGMEMDPALYTVSYFSDPECAVPINAEDIKACGTYYLKVTGKGDQDCTGVAGPASFQVRKAPLTVAYVSEIVEKDGTPAYEIVYDGFVGGEDESVLTTPASLPTPLTLQPGHSYTLTPEGAEAQNYEMTYVQGTLAVNPILIPKPACAAGLVYSGLDQVAVEPGVGYALSGTTHAANAGTYEATIELEDGYAWADGSHENLTYTWSIGKASLTAAFIDETIDANAAPALGVSVTGFVNGEAAGSAAGYQAPTASVSQNMRPGYSYTATVSGGAADNYSFTYVSGRVTMNRAVVEPPAATLSFDYDGSQKTAVAAGEEYDLSGVWAATDAGSYSATATLKDGYEWSDGTMAAKKFTWVIAPASGALSLDESELSLKMAEASSVGFSYTGDGAIGATSSDESVATASVEAGKVWVDAVGEGTARITVASSNCSNYTTPASVTLTVKVESISLTRCALRVANGEYTGNVFDAQPIVILPDGSELTETASYEICYYSDSACANAVPAGELKDVGSYWARAEAVAGSECSGSTSAVPFVISPASVAQAEIEGVDASYEFTGSPIKPVPVVKLGDKTLAKDVDYRISYSDNENVGEAFVLVEGIGNYTGSATASFAIAKAAYDMQGVSLESATVEYDGEAHSLAISGNLPSGLEVSYSGNGVTSAGDYVVTATFTGDSNHEPVASMSATLTIEKAGVVIPTAIQGLTYSGSQQEGVQVNGPYTLQGNSGTNAGDYTATATLNDSANYQWSNGTSNDQAVIWSIGKAKLSATYAGEAIEYGSTPSLDVEVTGFVNDESELSAAGYVAPSVQAASLDAGTYRLVPAGGSADNYDFTYVDGLLVIGKAPVTVVANPADKVYGQEDPDLTYEVLGAPKDDVARYVTVSRVAGEDVGEYAVSVSASSSPNYRITAIGSKLTISKADYDMSSVSFADGSFTYTGQPQSLQIEGELPAGVAVSYSGNGKTMAGEYSVTASFEGDSNHNPISAMEATLTIRKSLVEVPEVASDLVYTGAEQIAVQPDPSYTVVLGGSAVDAGQYRAIVILNDPANHTWADGSSAFREIAWSIATCTFNATSSSEVDVSGLTEMTYNGSAQTQSPTVAVNGITLVEGVDYTLGYENNINAGAATVTVTGKGNYAGTTSAQFTILPATIADASVEGLKNSTYNGKSQTQSPTVAVNGITLVEGVDYTLAYEDNINAGTATVTVTGKGNYVDNVKSTFSIAKAANPARVLAKKKAVKFAKVKKKAQTVKPITVSKQQGKVTYTKISKGSSKYLTVNKTTGKVTVKKGTKKGTYTIKVKVKIAGNSNYKALSKSLAVKVQVK